ncbi:UNVERIFIED_CONTAM: hypothetical protein FKN15_015425 [Acipenser sinensis]
MGLQPQYLLLHGRTGSDPRRSRAPGDDPRRSRTGSNPRSSRAGDDPRRRQQRRTLGRRRQQGRNLGRQRQQWRTLGRRRQQWRILGRLTREGSPWPWRRQRELHFSLVPCTLCGATGSPDDAEQQAAPGDPGVASLSGAGIASLSSARQASLGGARPASLGGARLASPGDGKLASPGDARQGSRGPSGGDGESEPSGGDCRRGARTSGGAGVGPLLSRRDPAGFPLALLSSLCKGGCGPPTSCPGPSCLEGRGSSCSSPSGGGGGGGRDSSCCSAPRLPFWLRRRQGRLPFWLRRRQGCLPFWLQRGNQQACSLCWWRRWRRNQQVLFLYWQRWERQVVLPQRWRWDQQKSTDFVPSGIHRVSVCLAQQCLSEETVTQQRAGSVESEQLTAGPDLQEAEVGGVSGCSSTRADLLQVQVQGLLSPCSPLWRAAREGSIRACSLPAQPCGEQPEGKHQGLLSPC